MNALYFSSRWISNLVEAMSKIYKNSYTLPKVVIDDYHETTPEEEYDHNFVFEVKALRSDRVELRPFIVRDASSDGMG